MSTTSVVAVTDLEMLELFRQDVEEHTTTLGRALLDAEFAETSDASLAKLMRAAHSLKGAARVVGNEVVVCVAHIMEDAFVAAREKRFELSPDHVDLLLQGVDLLLDYGTAKSEEQTRALIDGELPARFCLAITAALHGEKVRPLDLPVAAEPVAQDTATAPTTEGSQDRRSQATPAQDQFMPLLSLSGEAVVTASEVDRLHSALRALKLKQLDLVSSLSESRQHAALGDEARATTALQRAQADAVAGLDALVGTLADLDAFDLKLSRVTSRMYQKVLDARMQPFAAVTRTLGRSVRDLARQVGKTARLELIGESTPVDRDILRRLDAPLMHLIRNAISHGIEAPADRTRQGKRPEGRLVVEAVHRMGMLVITVSDDGRGVDVTDIKRVAVSRGHTTADIAEQMSRAELLEFLFLPGFSTATTVSEISGRGVGLDVVHDMVHAVGGRIHITSEPGQGLRIEMRLPLTLSVLRTLVVRISGELYAVPLTRVGQVVKVPRASIHSVEGREHILVNNRAIGLIGAWEILSRPAPEAGADVSVMLVGPVGAEYGLVVDAFVDEVELVVRPLDSRLGKTPNISAAAVMPDGGTVLIVDVDDLLRATQLLASGKRPTLLRDQAEVHAAADRQRRVLVVDDSITVRETERKLLEGAGYLVDVAVDGVDGWNAVRAGNYDLVLTDVDMPRMDGIELTRLIRRDHRLTTLPVMIVSYKDREEDRARGVAAGADYYLTKASFHDDTLLRAAASLLRSDA